MAPLDTAMATDEELVLEHARTGRREALDALVARHWAPAFRLAQRLTVDAALAEDAAQEAFVALVRGAVSFDGRRPFGPWFRTLVLNAARMSRRSRTTRRRHEERAAASRPEVAPTGDSRLDALELDERLRQLPEETRFPLVLHYYEGCTHDEVGAALGVPGTTARARVRKGVEQLREALAGAGAAWSIEGVESLLETARARVPAGPVPAPPSAELLLHLGRSASPAKLALGLAPPLLALALAAGIAQAFVGGSGATGAGGPVAGTDAAGANPGAAPVASGSSAGDASPPTSAGLAGVSSASASGATASVAGAGFLVTVKDGTGAVVPGARVFLRAIEPAEAAQRAQHPDERLCPKGVRLKKDVDLGVSDSSGHVAVGSREPGSFALLHAERGLDHGSSALLTAPASELAPVEIVVTPPERMRAGRGSLVVTVVGPGGPLANAELDAKITCLVTTSEVVDGKEERFGYQATVVPSSVAMTDGQGRFALHDLEVGLSDTRESYDLAVNAVGWKRATASFELGAGVVTRVVLELVPDRKLSVVGRVVRTNGAPVEGASVGFLEAQPWGGRRANGMSTGPDGTFELEAAAPGDVVVQASAPGFGSVSTPVSLRDGRVDLGEILLGRGVAVSGRAVTASGEPLASGRVALLSRTRPADLIGFVLAGTDGRFRFEGVAPGDYALGVLAGAGESNVSPREASEIPASVVVTAATEGDVDAGDVALAQARVVLHVLGPDGSPVADAEPVLAKVDARIVWSDKHTTQDGSAPYEAIAPGSYLAWTQKGKLVLPRPLAIEVAPGTSTDVELRLVRGGTIVGKVTGPAERLKTRAYVDANPDLDLWWLGRQEPIAADGNYRIEGCMPGTHHVSLLHGPDHEVDVVVVAGEEVRGDFALPTEVGRAAVTLVGRTQGQKAGYRAIAFTPAPVFDPIPTTLLGSDRWSPDSVPTIEELPPGPVVFGAVVPLSGGDPDDTGAGSLTLWGDAQTVLVGETLEVTLRVPAIETCGRLEGRVEPAPAAGESVRVVAVATGVKVEGRARADGTFSLASAPAGSYRVAAIASGREGTLSAVDVRAGETARVSLARP